MPYPHPVAEPLGQLAQPHAVVLIAAHDPEQVGTKPEHGDIVEHAAGLGAHGRVHHLAHVELADVAGERSLQQGLGVGTGHLELPQW